VEVSIMTQVMLVSEMMGQYSDGGHVHFLFDGSFGSFHLHRPTAWKRAILA